MIKHAKITGIAVMITVLTSCGEGTGERENAAAETVQTDANSASPNADTVNVPALVTPSANGSLALTAENGRAAGPDIKYMPEWRAFGWFTAADSVEWDVDVKTGGAYEAQLEWSVSDEEAGKEFILTANGRQLTGLVDKSGSWETFKTKDIGRINLEAGTQKLVFKSKTRFDKGALLDLRAIRLVPVPG